MRGLVIINGFPNGEKFYRQGERIQKALQNEGVETDLFKNGDVYAVIEENGAFRPSFSEKYDFCVYLDKDKYLSRMLENAGLRLFNRANAVETCDDKMTTYLALQKSGLRFAKTIPAPLCYTPHAKPNEKFLQKVEEKLGFPFVIKKSYGSFGAGVALVQNRAELYEKATEWLHIPHVYQAFVKESSGKDIRVIVVGGKALGGMERVAKTGEFRSNIELGGSGRKIALSEEYAKAAERAAKTLNLDYCGVDLLETDEGPIVCEVNSNAFFEGFEETLKIDVAAAYAKHIVQTI